MHSCDNILPKIVGASSEYPATVQLYLNTVSLLSFLIQQDVHLFRGSAFQGLSSLFAKSAFRFV